MSALPLDIAEEVADALAEGRAVVALESTIVSHGMPYPQNVETARSVEADLRGGGAIPATIAVIDGRLRVGLDERGLDRLALDEGLAKLSRADLAAVMAQGRSGATTVAATMIGAHLAGIKVFATGGIGGVHRGAETSFDVSADLHELARTPVTVVAAGPKAILDIGKTLEMLETLGVPVIVHGQDVVPAFWSRQSEFPAPLRMDTAYEIAHAHLMRARLGLGGGQLIANPIPEAAEIPAETLATLIEAALERAAVQGVVGKEVTPFLLDAVFDATSGASLDANIALVRNNARFAAEIAKELTTLPSD